MFMPAQIKVNFDSVAGAAEAKEELFDVIDFLKNPESISGWEPSLHEVFSLWENRATVKHYSKRL